jgi:hypothetical protein
MELKSVRTVSSPESPDRIRVVGEIAYDDRPGRVEELWFDFPRESASALGDSGNAWLVILAPMAASLGEPLRIGLPVDRLLLRNIGEVLAIWKVWYPSLHRIEVQADVDDPRPAGARTAAFFSGGVDSFFTILRNDLPEPGMFPADDLICVGGFDIPLRNIEAFRRHNVRQRAVADRLGKRYVDVVTNLRDTRLESANWFKLVHGPALIGIGLLMERRYRRLLIASSNDYGFPLPIGSHFLTDALFSTSGTRVLHDGAAFTRCGKVELLSRFPVALDNVHVCWRTEADDNCCACEKCLRTMVTLEVLGRLEGSEAFPRREIGAADLARIHLSRRGLQRYWEQIQDLALERGRPDIAAAIGRGIWKSRGVRPLIGVVNWLRGKRLVWRAAGPLRRRLLKDAYR